MVQTARPSANRGSAGAADPRCRIRRDEAREPYWAFDSPGIIPRGVLDETKKLIGQVAVRAPVAKDVYETFKSHFAAARGESSTYGSSSTNWAEADMEREMDDAAGNGPLFISAFADGCSELRAQKVGVPSVDRINQMLAQSDAGYRVDGDTVVGTGHHTKPQPRPNPPAPNLVASVPSTTPKRAGSPKHDESPNLATASLLQVFLCHSKGDKPAVLALHARLRDDGYDPWLDVKKLVPGQDWQAEIKAAVKKSHVVIVCLSAGSVTKAGFVQREIRFALDVADEQPPGRIYIIPARLEECQVPELLSKYHWVDLFEEDGYDNLLKSLEMRAADL